MLGFDSVSVTEAVRQGPGGRRKSLNSDLISRVKASRRADAGIAVARRAVCWHRNGLYGVCCESEECLWQERMCERMKWSWGAERAHAAWGPQEAAAAEADARNPVLRLRKLVAEQGGAGAAEAVRALDVEGGLVGRMRALYEVRAGSDCARGSRVPRRGFGKRVSCMTLSEAHNHACMGSIQRMRRVADLESQVKTNSWRVAHAAGLGKWCRAWRAQALFADVEEGAKLADRAGAHAALLAALAPDPASQMAQLLGLEFLLGETLPARAKEVRCGRGPAQGGWPGGSAASSQGSMCGRCCIVEVICQGCHVEGACNMPPWEQCGFSLPVTVPSCGTGLGL